MSEWIRKLLGEALDAVEARDFERVLDRLLSAWAQVRDPRLADLIDRVSIRVAATRPALPSHGRRAIELAWRERITSGDIGDVAVLLDSFADVGATELRQRLGLLLRAQGDPRIAREVASLMAAPSGTPSTIARWWPKAIEVLERHFDPRVLTTLAQRDSLGHDHHGQLLDRDLSRLLDRVRWLSDQAQLSGGLSELVEHIGLGLPAPEPVPGSEPLLRSLITHPRDEAQRQVYSDYLLGHADPRGEFIALQLRARHGELGSEGLRRMTRLERVYGCEWLHEIGWALVPGSVVFEAGFPIRARVRRLSRPTETLVGKPSWATIETLVDPPVELLHEPMLCSLWAIDVDHLAALRILEAETPLPAITRLTWRPAYWNSHDNEPFDPAHRAVLERHRGLPNLRELELALRQMFVDVEQFSWLWRGPLGGKLEQLTIAGRTLPEPRIDGWLRSLRESSTTIRRVSLESHGLRWGMCQGAGSWSEVELAGIGPFNHRDLLAELDALIRMGGVRVRADEALANGRDQELRVTLDQLRGGD